MVGGGFLKWRNLSYKSEMFHHPKWVWPQQEKGFDRARQASVNFR